MYESFFNLKTKPFDLLPNPSFLYLSLSHKKAMTYLDYALQERAGFILLTGAIGSGKTTLIRGLINKHQNNIMLAKISNTRVSSEQLISMINDDFGIPVNSGEKTYLLRDLNDFLIEQYAKGNKPVLIIDEAQNLTPEILEDVRMLSNLETDTAKLLQIILVGQPELSNTLALPELVQLRQRISFFCHIRPLMQKELEHYIKHRLDVAGNREAVTFLDGALDMIWKYSRGIPRLINIICDFLLLSAFAEETNEISLELTKEVIGELDFENQFWSCRVPEESAGRELHKLKAEHIQSKTDLVVLLQGITRRLDKMENVAAEQRMSVIDELEQKIATLGNALEMHVEQTKSTVQALQKKIEMMKSGEKYAPVIEDAKATGESFLRRILK